MRILLITQEFPPYMLGGVGYHAYYLARALVKQGHSVHILCGLSEGHRSDSSSFEFAGLEVTRINYRRLPGLSRLYFNYKVINWLNNNDTSKFDAIHSHEIIDWNLIDFDGPIVLKIHSNVSEKKASYINLNGRNRYYRKILKSIARNFLWPLETKLERRSIRSSDIRIYNSELTRRLSEIHHKMDERNSPIVYNGVASKKFSPSSSKNSGDFFLFVGGCSHRKGYPIVMKTFTNRGGRSTVKLVGANEASVACDVSGVEFLDHVSQDELIALMQRASALIHPAIYEPFGNVVLESLACGTPVITSNRKYCGAAEILTDEVSFRIDPKKQNALDSAIESYDHNEYSSQSCRNFALQYDWGNVAKSTIRAISLST